MLMLLAGPLLLLADALTLLAVAVLLLADFVADWDTKLATPLMIQSFFSTT